MIRLALTDLDNTLIPVGAPHASMHAIAAIHAALDAGMWFGPVSGRVPAAMRWMFGGDDACSRTGAFVNGQLVYADDKLIHAELLARGDLLHVAEWIAPHEGCALVVYDLSDVSETTDGTAYYLGARADELARHQEVFGNHPRTLATLENGTYVKANLRCDLPRPQMVALRNALRKEFPQLDFVFPANEGPFVDILPHGWGKGRAVEVLMDHLGLARDEVAVFGDSENDISMFEVVEHSVAVQNAGSDAAAYARHHIGSSEDDAVADALFALAEAARTGDMPEFCREDCGWMRPLAHATD